MIAPSRALELAARRNVLRQAFAPGWALLTCLLVIVQAPTGLRAPVAIVFFFLVPGTALVGLFNVDSSGLELSLSVALSVAVSGVTAGILVYAHLWSPTAVVVIVTLISLVAGLRDIELSRREGHGAEQLLRLLRAGARRIRARGLPAEVLQTAQLAFQEAGSLPGAIATEPGPESPPQRRTTPRSVPEQTEEPPVAASPLQRFLLDELQQRTGSPTSSAQWRGRPPSLADLDPHELAELLSWSSLQHFVMRRAIRKVNPELWFVDDLERRLWSQPPDEPNSHTPPAPRGVWISGVAVRASIPVAWRVLEGDRKKKWRTRLALEMIDALSERGLGEAVVAADTGYGSLAGFRRGLMARGLSYLLRVDPVTAARALALDRPCRSAAEARDILQERIAEEAQTQVVRDEPELVLVEGAEQLLIFEVPAVGGDSAFWLSNLPVGTVPERFAPLVRLANRGRIERDTPDLLQVALEMAAEEGTAKDDVEK